MKNQTTSANLVETAVVGFWGVFPQFWHQIRAHTAKVAEQYDVTRTEFLILKRVDEGFNSVSKLAESKHISPPAISRMVDGLVEKGLISRTEDPQDRRCTMLNLTDEGRDVLGKIFSENKAWMIEKFKGANTQELEALILAFQFMKTTMD